MQVDHSKYMSRCLELARLAEGHTAPNPTVGSVIVHNGKIIGEGFHQKAGMPHAEVNAIRSVRDRNLLHQSTLYVNLEPCSHHGKTPPCSDLIINEKIGKVVVGTVDPNPLVAGRGIVRLRDAGCEVFVGVLEQECLWLNRRFFTVHQKGRPYIILKWAQTIDGFVDTNRNGHELGVPNWITNEIARVAVHRQRSTENAILIGTTTALRDNPSLTLRDWYGNKPLRLIFDMNSRLPSSLRVFTGEAPTATIVKAAYTDGRKTNHILISQDNVLDNLLQWLKQNNVQSVVVEGGPYTLQQFISSRTWDEAHVYVGSGCFGEGIKAPVIEGKPRFEEFFGSSRLSVFINGDKIE